MHGPDAGPSRAPSLASLPGVPRQVDRRRGSTAAVRGDKARPPFARPRPRLPSHPTPRPQVLGGLLGVSRSTRVVGSCLGLVGVGAASAASAFAARHARSCCTLGTDRCAAPADETPDRSPRGWEEASQGGEEEEAGPSGRGRPLPGRLWAAITSEEVLLDALLGVVLFKVRGVHGLGRGG
jgi:hypothetical protein